MRLPLSRQGVPAKGERFLVTARSTWAWTRSLVHEPSEEIPVTVAPHLVESGMNQVRIHESTAVWPASPTAAVGRCPPVPEKEPTAAFHTYFRAAVAGHVDISGKEAASAEG